ncbi:STAS domain-containing protein [Planctomycetota bacterium]
MNTIDWSEDIILVELRQKRREQDELQRIIDRVREWGDCDVIVDFSRVDVVGGTTLTRLLELRQLLQDRERTLVLCSVAPATKGVFTVTRLDEVFDFAKDRLAALAHFQPIEQRRYA